MDGDIDLLLKMESIVGSFFDSLVEALELAIDWGTIQLKIAVVIETYVN